VNVISNHDIDSKGIPYTSLIFHYQQRHPFVELCWSLLNDWRRRSKGVESFGDQKPANGEVWSEFNPLQNFVISTQLLSLL
jgi:hypothetical protein